MKQVKPLMLLKGGAGLVYVTIALLLLLFGEIFVTDYIMRLTWFGAALFWIIGTPIVVGLFRFLATLIAMPAVYLMSGQKGFCWFLLLPALYFTYCYIRTLWLTASARADALGWILAVSIVSEVLYMHFVFMVCIIGKAYDDEDTN